MGQQRTDRAPRHSDRQQAVRRRNRAQVARTSQPPQRQTSIQLWLSLFGRHSPLLLVLTWAVLLGATIAAVTAIVDPDVSVQPSLKTRPDTASQSSALVKSNALPVQRLTERTQPRRSQAAENGSPLSAGGALLVSCAGGCLLLSRCLQPKAAPRRKRTIPKLATKPQPLAFDAIEPALTEATRSEMPVKATAAQPQAEPPQGQEDQVKPSLPETPVSVLAQNQSHPLDWNEPSLADSLDLRQKRPLSYWLRG